MAKKYYVVWIGRKTGIFTDWDTCKNQVDKFTGARFKSFATLREAEAAFRGRGTNAAPATESVPAVTLAPAAASEARDGASAKPAIKRAAGRPAAKTPKTYTAREIAGLTVNTKIFTDGGCDPNPGKAGSGIAVYRDEVVAELWYGLFNPQGTNNTAELNALHQGMIMAKNEIASGRSVAIFCDSQYSIQCITTWAIGWEKKGWTKSGGEIKNLTLIKEMFALYQSLKEEVQILHVNGHVGVEGNELADRMSIMAIASRASAFMRYDKTLNTGAILAMKAG